MATKNQKQAPIVTLEATETVDLTLDTAKMLYDLYRNVKLADAHYHNCQAHNFRDHVQSAYRSTNISAAFDALKKGIEAIEEGGTM